MERMKTLSAFIGGLGMMALGIIALTIVVLICLPIALCCGGVKFDEF